MNRKSSLIDLIVDEVVEEEKMLSLITYSQFLNKY